MTRLALVLLLAMVRVAPAHAGIAVDAGVPFTVAELTTALALRGAPATDIVVRAVSPTLVELQTSVGRQRVELGAMHGTAAARLVALQLAPLGGDTALAARAELAAGGPGAPSWEIGVAGGGGRGVAALDFALTALRADAMQRSGAWRWGISAGWLHGLARSPDGRAPATADLYPLRAIAGVVAGRFELVAGPEVVAYRVTAASPGFAGGAGGAVRARFAAGPQWHSVASLDVEGFLHRVIVARDGMQFAATPRVAVTATLGVVWGAP